MSKANGRVRSRQWRPVRHRGFAGLRALPATHLSSARALPTRRPRRRTLTPQAHLTQHGLAVPVTSTTRRILHHHVLITPEPCQRSRSSYGGFAAEQPNECGQPDFTHWTASGTEVEILNWLDDHSRFLLVCTRLPARHRPRRVVAGFTAAATLTDNGAVYTSRFIHGHNDFERLLASLGIIQKYGHHNHPQTQGNIERFPKPSNAGSRPGPTPPPPTTYKPCSTRSDPLQHPMHPPRPPRTNHTRTGLPSPTQSPPHRPTLRTLRHPARHRRPIGQTHLRQAAGYTTTSALGIGATHAQTPVLSSPLDRHRPQQDRPLPL